MKKQTILAALLLASSAVMADSLTLRGIAAIQNDYAYPDVGVSYNFIQFPNNTGFNLDADFLYAGNKETSYGSVLSIGQSVGLSFYNNLNDKWSLSLGAGLLFKQEKVFCDIGASCPGADSNPQNYFKFTPSYYLNKNMSLGLQLMTTSESPDASSFANVGLVFGYKFN